MIGDPPRNEHVRRLFDWADAVIRIDSDDKNIAGVLEDLESQPDRVAGIRRNNVANALLQHDWLYRWDAVLEAAGLTSMAAADARRRRLEELAEAVLGSWTSTG